MVSPMDSFAGRFEMVAWCSGLSFLYTASQNINGHYQQWQFLESVIVL